jgi:hypothetical protein
MKDIVNQLKAHTLEPKEVPDQPERGSVEEALRNCDLLLNVARNSVNELSREIQNLKEKTNV